MKRKIIISLFACLMIFTIGFFTSLNLIYETTSYINYIVKQNQVERMRQSMVNDLQTVQTGLYSIRTSLDNGLETAVKNVASLAETSQLCSNCHHLPYIDHRINDIGLGMKEYKDKIDSLNTLSINSEKFTKLRKTTISLGSRLLALTVNMTHFANDQLDTKTNHILNDVRHAKFTLVIIIIAVLVLIIVIALRLMRSITKPINLLLQATRKISSGKLGTTISFNDSTEFGELARQFNNMSTAINESYEKIQKEIKEREIAEDALIKSENFLSMTFNSIRDPFCIFNRDFKIVKANSAYAELKQQSLDNLYGVRCYEALKGIDSKCKNCIVDVTFQSKDPCAKDKLITLKDGTEIWLDIYTYPIYDDQGKVTYVIEYIRDISERKKAENSLRESKERYALAAEGVNDGLWDWDLYSDSIYYSPRWKYMLGLSNSEVNELPSEWLKRIHPDDRKIVESELQSHLSGDIDHFEAEYRMLHSDGIYIWVQVRGMAKRDISGKPLSNGRINDRYY